MRNRPIVVLSIVIAGLAITVAALLLGIALDGQDFVTVFGPGAPVLAAAVATASLAVTATSTFLGARRKKRLSTIDAWNAWSDSTATARDLISTHLGMDVISGEQGRGLVDKVGVLKDKTGNPLGADDKRRVHASMILLLNGLERLAVGTASGVYDLGTLADLGGTIIVRTRERFDPYIQLRRNTEDTKLRQARAYTELDRLVTKVRQKHIDQERVNRLRR